MHSRLTFAVFVLLVLMVTATSRAQPPRQRPAEDPAAAELRAQMRQAYGALRAYDATIELEIVTREQRWTVTRACAYRVTFDRPANRLSIDRPELLLVCDGATLRLRSDHYPGRYLEVAAPRPLEYGALVGVVPFLGEPPLPMTVPLLSDDPVGQLSGGTPRRLKALPPDSAGQPGLHFDTSQGQMTLRLDPQSHLVQSAELIIEAPPEAFLDHPLAVIRYAVGDQTANGQPDGDRFAFDTTDQQAVATLEELFGGQAGPVPGSERPNGGIIGMGTEREQDEAPPVALQKADGQPYRLEDDPAKVVVLNFWASWNPMCRPVLKDLEAVRQWAEHADKSVAIYAVNVQESPQQAQQVWAQEGLNLPVLIDSDSRLADAYGVQVLPHTVVIYAGRIMHVHTVHAAELDKVLKVEIEKLLANEPVEDGATGE